MIGMADWLFSFDDPLFKLLTLLVAFAVCRTIYSRKGNFKKRRSPLSPSCQSVLQPGPERIRTSVFKWNDPDCTVTTVHEAFRRGQRLTVDGECLGYRPTNSPTYKWITYDEIYMQALSLGSALRAFEEPAGNIVPVGIYSSNRPEWFVSSLAMTSQSIPIVPLYDTFGSSNLLHIVVNAQLETIICENGSKLERLMDIKRSGRTRLRRIVLVDFDEAAMEHLRAASSEQDLIVESYADLVRRAGNVSAQMGTRLPRPDTLYMICYTSGSTGSPKGAMITHNNAIMSAKSTLLLLTEQNVNSPSYSTYVSYLPMAHIYEQACQVIAIFLGKKIGFYSGNVSQLMDDMKALRPHWFPAVPRVLNRIHDKVLFKLKTQPPWKRFLFWAAIRWKLLERRLGIQRNNGIVDRLVFNRIRQQFGGRLSVCLSGSAPTSSDVLATCRAMLGCTLVEGYGQTETAGPVTATLVDDLTSGHVGALAPKKEMKLVDVPELNYWAAEDKGEICIRGDTVTSGYYKDDQKSSEIIDKDGWLHTGDVGQWLPNGALKIIDRKKHIFKLSQGEYVAPENIENVYTRCPWISQLFVDGHSRQSYLVAVVVPDEDMLLQWAAQEGLIRCPVAQGKASELERLCKVEKVKSHILDQLRRTGASHGLNSLEQVRKIHLTAAPFTIEDGLLTPTLKNCRSNLRNRFRDCISEMYASAVH
uniref:long-chain-fatty-acid--CoA ligase n=1 Tax=Trichuris muris TaxID=70415 RepID=A0A5S6PYI0_TRIMR